MSNPFDKVAGDANNTSNPFDAASSSNPFDKVAKAAPVSANPFDSVSVPSSPNVPNASTAEGVKSLIGQMPQFREDFFGQPQLINGSIVDQSKHITKEQQLENENTSLGSRVASDIFGPPDEAKVAIAKAQAKRDADYNASDKGAFAKLRYYASPEYGKEVADIAQKKSSETNPLNIVAKNTVGAVGRIAQDYVGQPIANIAMRSLTHTLADEQPRGMIGPVSPNPSKEEWAQLSEQQRREFIPSYSEQSPSELQARTQGLSIGQFPQPPKYVTPTSQEAYFRRFLSSLGGDSMKLSPAKEKEALGEQVVSIPLIGDTDLVQLKARVAEFGGELPFYAIGTTGIGEKLAANKIAALEEGPLLSPKELVKGTAAARAEGAATEFGIQSGAVAAKNKEDVGAAQVEGYIGGRVFEKVMQTATFLRGAKKEVLASVNEKRAGLLLPPITWEQFSKEAAAAAKGGGMVNRGPKQLNGLTGNSKTLGTADADYSYKTVEHDEDGDLVEVRYLLKADGERVRAPKKTYQTPVTSKELRSYGETGEAPIKTDSAAYSDYLNRKFPSPEPQTAHRYGTQGYMSPEQQAEVTGMTQDELLQWARRQRVNETPVEQLRAEDSGPTSNERPRTQTSGPVEDSTIELNSPFPMHDPHEALSFQDVAMDDSAPHGVGYNERMVPQGNYNAPLDNEAIINQEQHHLNLGLENNHHAVMEANARIGDALDNPLHNLRATVGGEFDRAPWVNPLRARRDALANSSRPTAQGGDPLFFNVRRDGTVDVVPLRDRTPTADLATPPHPVEGDVAHLPDGQAGIVSDVKDGIATVDLGPGARSVKVSTAELAAADENQLYLSRLVRPEQKGLLSFKKLDIKRVMNVKGFANPSDALEELYALENAGQVTYVGNGEWYVKKSYKPEPLDTKPKDQDYVVYYGTGDNGMGLSGVLRGRDPKKPGNVLIEVDEGQIGPRTQQQYQQAAQLSTPSLPVQGSDIAISTKLRSVPADKVRSYAPILGRANRSQLPAQYGVSVPMPKDVIVTSPAAAKAVSDYSRMAGSLAKLLSKTDAIKTGMMKLINHDAWLLPLDIRAPGTKLASQPGLVKGQAEIYQKQFAKMFGGELSPMDTEVARIAKLRATRTGKGQLSEQEKELAAFFAKNPQLDAEVKQTVTVALQRLKDNNQILASLGVTKIENLEKLRAMGLEDEYVMNVYAKYLLSRKDYAEFARTQLPDLWQQAITKLSKPNEYVWQTEKRMLDVMSMDIEDMRATVAKDPNGAVSKKLKERIQLSDEISKIIGKVDGASIQVAHSLAVTDSMINRIKTWNTVAESPYWSPGPRPDLGPHSGIQVPDSPIYGAARKGYVHEGFRFLVETKPPHVQAMGILRSMSSMWKFNQVIGGGMPTWVNNIMRNWKGMVFSGGLQGPEDFKTFFDAAEQMINYSRNPILGKGSIYEQAMQNGAGFGAGFHGSEVNRNRAAARVLEAIKKQHGVAHDEWELLANITHAIKGTAEEVGMAYDAIDRVFKLTAYMNNYRRCLARGMTADDAAAYSTMRNNQSFPNYELVSSKVESLRSGQLSGIAPFLTSKMEDLRVNGTMLMRLAKEPDLIARMAGATAVLSSVYALMREQRRANGISDAMVKQGLDTPKLSIQAFHPAGMIWPSLDSQRRMQIVDLTQWEDALIMLQMHERDFAPAAILRNNVTGVFAESTLLGNIANASFNVATGVVPLSGAPQMIERPGEQSPLAWMAWMAQQGAVPQGPLKIYRAWSMSQPSQTLKDALEREQWTSEQANAKYWGAPFALPIGKATEVGRAREFAQNAKAMESQMYETIMKQPPEKWPELLNAKGKALQEIINEYQNRGK